MYDQRMESYKIWFKIIPPITNPLKLNWGNPSKHSPKINHSPSQQRRQNGFGSVLWLYVVAVRSKTFKIQSWYRRCFFTMDQSFQKSKPQEHNINKTKLMLKLRRNRKGAQNQNLFWVKIIISIKNWSTHINNGTSNLSKSRRNINQIPPEIKFIFPQQNQQRFIKN